MLLLIDCKKKLSEKKSKPAVHSNGFVNHKEEKTVSEEREPLTNNGSFVEIDERIAFVSTVQTFVFVWCTKINVNSKTSSLL